MRNDQLRKAKAFSDTEEIPGNGVSSEDILPGEVWKDIPGYEGKYQASSLGRVRSLDRYVKSRLGKTEYLRYYPGKMLKSGTTKTRHYEQVTLSDNARISVHALVAAAFHGPCPPGCEVLHINGNVRDNRPENLRYDTHSENMHDIYYQGGRSKKLHSEDVFQIRFGKACGIKAKELAQMYCIDVSNIYKLLKGVSFSYL